MNSVTMMFFIFVISLLHLGSTTVQRRAYAGCPNGWTVYEQSCYITGHTAVDFHSAVTFCHHYHGKLVEIETDAENDFLRNFLVDFKDPNHWIGLTDSIIEGEWRWYSNDLVASYVDWYPGEPNNEKLHNCALTYGSGQYNHHWVDAPCNGKYFPLCELPS
ncbi:C-type lectin domain 17 [Mactra antiquata]